MEISSAVPAEIAERMNDKPYTLAHESFDDEAAYRALKDLVDDLMTFGQYPWNAKSKSDRKADLAEWIADNMDGFDAAMALVAHIRGDEEISENFCNSIRSMLMDHYRDSELVQWIAREE